MDSAGWAIQRIHEFVMERTHLCKPHLAVPKAFYCTDAKNISLRIVRVLVIFLEFVALMSARAKNPENNVL